MRAEAEPIVDIHAHAEWSNGDDRANVRNSLDRLLGQRWGQLPVDGLDIREHRPQPHCGNRVSCRDKSPRRQETRGRTIPYRFLKRQGYTQGGVSAGQNCSDVSAEIFGEPTFEVTNRPSEIGIPAICVDLNSIAANFLPRAEGGEPSSVFSKGHQNFKWSCPVRQYCAPATICAYQPQGFPPNAWPRPNGKASREARHPSPFAGHAIMSFDTIVDAYA